jgi:ribonuclease HI
MLCNKFEELNDFYYFFSFFIKILPEIFHFFFNFEKTQNPTESPHPLFSKIRNDSNFIEFKDNNLNVQPLYIRCRKLLCQYNLPIKVDNKFEYNIPPWSITNIKIDLSFTKFKKTTISNLMFRKLFQESFEKYSNFDKIFTDGTHLNSQSGCAYTLNDFSQKYNLGNHISIFSAELFAIFFAIQISSNAINKKFAIYTDSLSSIQAISKLYSKNPIVQRIQERISNSSNYYTFIWIPSHVGIAGNELVDSLAKSSIQDSPLPNLRPNKLDLRKSTKKSIATHWNNNWDQQTADNKLKRIKSNTKPWKNLDDLTRQEATLTRLRIGHTRLTHSFLINIKPIRKECRLPFKDACQYDFF